ncbi:MAG: hypothetical protein QXI77_01980 [Nanopusillaceae archaeon]
MACIDVCLVTGITGSLITKYLGISDSIFGLWLGYTSYIAYVILNAKITNKTTKYIILLYLFSSILMGSLFLSMWNPYKIIIGIIAGIIIGFLMSKLNVFLLEKRLKFSRYQGIIISIVGMIIISIILYILNI